MNSPCVSAVLIDIGSPPKVANSTDKPCSNDGSDTEAQVLSATPSENQPAQQSAYKQILSLKAVHLMAFYILVYVGVEVTIGGEPIYKDKVQCMVLKKSDRLDRDVSYSRTRWRVVIWIRFVWFLWWLVTTKA